MVPMLVNWTYEEQICDYSWMVAAEVYKLSAADVRTFDNKMD